METSDDFLSESIQNLNKLSKEHIEDYETLDLAPWEREVLDMLHATRLVHSIANGSSRGFSGDNVIAINRTVMAKEFTLNPHIFGKLRGVNVQIKYTIDGKEKTSPNEPLDHKLLPEVFNQYSEELFDRTKGISRETPVGEILDTAAWASLELIRFHPFVEGNGRTSRLLVDLVFERAGLPYITDWGSRNQEYLKTVYKAFKEDKPELYQKFLAGKLIKSLTALEKEGSGVAEFTTNTRLDVEEYLQELK